MPRATRRRNDALLLDRARLAPAVELVLAVAELAEDFVGMLPELRRERPDRCRRVREFRRDADLLELPAALAFDLNDHVARLYLRIVRHLVEREHPADADVVLAQYFEPLVARPGLERLGERLRDFRTFAGVVLVRNEILAAERAAQVGEEPRLDRRDGNIFV